jgi:hypothetical protein
MFTSLSRFHRRFICDRLPPVATALLHERSIPPWSTRRGETYRCAAYVVDAEPPALVRSSGRTRGRPQLLRRAEEVLDLRSGSVAIGSATTTHVPLPAELSILIVPPSASSGESEPARRAPQRLEGARRVSVASAERLAESPPCPRAPRGALTRRSGRSSATPSGRSLSPRTSLSSSRIRSRSAARCRSH